MKTIMITELSAEITALLEQAREDDVLVQLADGREFLVRAIDEFDHEIAQTRQNEKLMAFLEERAKQTHTIPLDEVKRQLGLGE